MPPVVLVVDDNDDQRELMKRALEFCGCTVRESRGTEALNRLAGWQVDCLVIDEYLSDGLRGHELVLEARRVVPGLRVVLTSSHGQPPDGVPFEAAYLPKPCHVIDLMVSVRQDGMRARGSRQLV
ncbi:MAG: response regulator [Pseudoxanthomonas sp.]|nr:response regulator [Pseudoxanthomonas sp.]